MIGGQGGNIEVSRDALTGTGQHAETTLRQLSTRVMNLQLGMITNHSKADLGTRLDAEFLADLLGDRDLTLAGNGDLIHRICCGYYLVRILRQASLRCKKVLWPNLGSLRGEIRGQEFRL